MYICFFWFFFCVFVFELMSEGQFDLFYFSVCVCVSQGWDVKGFFGFEIKWRKFVNGVREIFVFLQGCVKWIVWFLVYRGGGGF